MPPKARRTRPGRARCPAVFSLRAQRPAACLLALLPASGDDRSPPSAPPASSLEAHQEEPSSRMVPLRERGVVLQPPCRTGRPHGLSTYEEAGRTERAQQFPPLLPRWEGLGVSSCRIPSDSAAPSPVAKACEKTVLSVVFQGVERRRRRRAGRLFLNRRSCVRPAPGRWKD